MGFDPKKILNDGLAHALAGVQAESLYKKYLHLYDNTLYFRNTPIFSKDQGRLLLAASGKAAYRMAGALLPYLPCKPRDSLLIAPEKCKDLRFRIRTGNHPVPGNDSLEAGREMLAFLESLDYGDTLIYLLSGGSSAMLEFPVPGISLAELQMANRLFLERGMHIREINQLRGRLSKVKAGKLAAACKAGIHVMVLSDVMGNDFRVIGSGPFAHFFDEGDTAGQIIQKYRLDKDLPAHVIKQILNGGNPNTDIRDVPHYLIGSNMDLLEAAETYFSGQDLPVQTFPESLSGEARESGLMIADMIRLYRGPRPSVMLLGGECTVTLNREPGKGGRNQETALAALSHLKDLPGYALLCAGSDGRDGNVDAAGALIDRDTFLTSQKFGLSPEASLQHHDSYQFHRRCGSLIKTGPSGTNAADISIVFLH